MAAVKRQAVLLHHFDGDAPMLSATTDRREDLRASLFALQQEICAGTLHAPVEILAVIKIRVIGRDVEPVVPTKEHVYTLTITDKAFNLDKFKSLKTPNQPITKETTAALAAEIAQGINLKRKAAAGGDDDDVLFKGESTPKRPRIESNGNVGIELPINAHTSKPTDTSSHQETMTFLRDWRREWQSQGGWIFDTLSAAKVSQASADVARSHQLVTMQTHLTSVLDRDRTATQHENAATQRALQRNEEQRKVHAQRVETREDEWRSSSATFHDRSKTERQAVEARIEEKLASRRDFCLGSREREGSTWRKLTWLKAKNRRQTAMRVWERG